MQMRRFSPLLLVALLATTPVLLAARSEPAEVTQAPTTDEAGAARLVYGLLSDSRYAYRPKALDDTLSAEIFDGYLDALDGDRLFFVKADIDRFAAYRAQLDDAIRGGELRAPFDIFNVYVQRVGERTAYARGLLKAGFDFDQKETWQFDREDAPWAADDATLNDLWRKYVKNDWLRLKLAGKTDDEIRKTLDKRYTQLGSRVREIKSEEVFQTFMNAYASAIDPHTAYMTPRSAQNFNLAMSLSLEGIGAVLQRQDDFIVIREIVPGGPAALSGKLKPGDRIAAVGQGKSGPMTDVVGWRIDDVVDLIRGPKDSQVRLDVIPAEAGVDGAHAQLTITRQKVKLEEQAAKSKVLEIDGHRVGVITLPAFYQDFEGRRKNASDYASATRDVARLLGELKVQKVDGVVMDLRNNGGGSLTEAVELTGLFIDTGPVVQVRESGGRVSVEGDGDAGVAWDGPLAVLVNRSSASASEIFAGAIQDYGRGLIIGEPTFGKGTVQNLINLDRWPRNETERFGQLKLTVAQFFRVNGGSTQHKGVVPDVQFPVTLDAADYGESSYDNALPWTQIAAAPHARLGQFGPLLPQLVTRHSVRVAGDREFGWWSEDVAKYRVERARKSLSLNESERRAERAADEAKREQRDAERKAAGLATDPTVELANDDGLQADERDIRKDVAREKAAEERPDPLLRESVAILGDAIDLLAEDRQLAAQVLPASSRHDPAQGARMVQVWTD